MTHVLTDDGYVVTLPNGSRFLAPAHPTTEVPTTAANIDEVVLALEALYPMPAPPPKYATSAAAILAMVTWIEALHAKITGPVPSDVKLGWKAKADWARAWDANTNPDVPTIYSDEMTAAGLAKYPDTQSFVTRVIAKADIYEGVIADTEGLRGRVQDALEAESDPEQFEVILQAAQVEAMGKLTERGITLPG